MSNANPGPSSATSGIRVPVEAVVNPLTGTTVVEAGGYPISGAMDTLASPVYSSGRLVSLVAGGTFLMTPSYDSSGRISTISTVNNNRAGALSITRTVVYNTDGTIASIT